MGTPLATDAEFNDFLLRKDRDACVDCEGCPLHWERTQIVFGRGAAKADLMVIGDAPEERSDAAGKPFVGPEGKLLRKAAKVAGMGGIPAYITYAVMCRPPDDRNPTSDERKACLARLGKQIRVVDPKAILLLGDTAASLFRIRTASEHRGFIEDYEDRWPFSGCGTRVRAVMVTISPGFILRKNSIDKRRKALRVFASDLRKIARVLK